MINRKILFSLALLLVIPAHADQFHYNDILVGDRASGMGGAYTAISDDPTGMFYNPAGIVLAPNRSTSSSSLAYQNKTKRYESVIGVNDWLTTSSSFIPNFFGILQPIGDGYFGLSYVMNESVDLSQAQTFTFPIPVNIDPNALPPLEKFSINYDEEDTIYKVGPSYARPLSDNLSIGVTLYLHARNRNVSFNQVAELYNSAQPADEPYPDLGYYDWTNQQISQSELGFNPIIGLMWSPSEHSSLGLTLQKTIIFSAETITECTKQTPDGIADLICGEVVNPGTDPANPLDPDNPPTGNDYAHFVKTSNGYADPPWQLGMGWASFPNNKQVFSADVNLYFGGSNFPTWNAAMGYEHYLSSRWNTRLGLFTNNSNQGVPTGVNGYEKIDELGLSLSLGRFTRTSSVSLGVSYLAGRGTRGGISSVSPITTVTSDSLTLYLTAYYTS
ncbi:MAG: hypothetical protein OEX12_00415 [Gammaproteobacteria bacterium]|nr:hypothetical protein [Gammaproteobacteria bacterium]